MSTVPLTTKPAINSLHQCSSVSKNNKGRIVLYQRQLSLMSDSLQCTWLLISNTDPHNGNSVYVLKFTMLHLFPGCFMYIYGGSGHLYRKFSSDARAPQEIKITGARAFLKLTVPSFLLSQGSVGNFSVDYESGGKCVIYITSNIIPVCGCLLVSLSLSTFLSVFVCLSLSSPFLLFVNYVVVVILPPFMDKLVMTNGIRETLFKASWQHTHLMYASQCYMRGYIATSGNGKKL